MTGTQFQKTETATTINATGGRLFVLDLSGGPRAFDETRWSEEKAILTGCGRYLDGIAVDIEAGHVYWSNMGVPSQKDGSIERSDLDGENRRFIVPEGGTTRPSRSISIRPAASCIGRTVKECA